jgi:hypothetical protein
MRSLLIFLVSVRPVVVMLAPAVTSRNLAPGRPSLAGSRRSMGRGVEVAGGQIDKAGLLQIGESGF